MRIAVWPEFTVGLEGTACFTILGDRAYAVTTFTRKVLSLPVEQLIAPKDHWRDEYEYSCDQSLEDVIAELPERIMETRL